MMSAVMQKLFADDTSLFTVVYDETVAADQLNRDLKVVTDWAYQWKMQFNPDINKQAVQVIFSQKRMKPIQPPLFFNDAPVVIKDERKHLGMVLDSALNFRSHERELELFDTCRNMFRVMFWIKCTNCTCACISIMVTLFITSLILS